MYNPTSFVEDRVDLLHSFIRQNPLATVVTCGSSGPEASHVPVVFHTCDESKGLLRFHLARANDQWKNLQLSPIVLAIFRGVDHYVTPSWYPSKQKHGKVVPTWNYVAVHVRGRAKTFESGDELLQHLHTLTDQNEHALGTQWSVSDAPKDYVEGLSKAIIGIEVSIDTIEGKAKVSQNRSEDDREGVVAGLKLINSDKSTDMAQLVAQRGLK
jgi:transcriptional regulator